MKLIYDGTNENGGDGHIEFEFQGYHYHIGEIDNGDGHWFQRQSIDDYNNNRDNWEEARWEPIVGSRKFFKFLSKDNL